ncbi:glycosyltransferase [Nitrosospira multiformis]|nr:glycosyltransferase [Nitrosospira multiformis]
MELRLADIAGLLAKGGHIPLLGLSPFPGRDLWLDRVLTENPTFSRFEFDPPPFFEEWAWRRRNLALARTFWVPKLRHAGIGLAHIFYAWTFEGGTRLWLCHKAGIPSVLSIHNAFPNVQLTPWHERLTRESFVSIRGLYAVSQSALDHFISIYGAYLRDKTATQVIPNAVDVSRFIPSPDIRHQTRFELSIPQNAKVIGSIGRIDEQKEPFHVLKVFECLWRCRQDIFLLFCGQGPLEAMVRAEVASKPWGDRVRFLGFRKDVDRVFPALDVHLLLSRQEGFGTSTVEAMACGIPVVATNVPGTRDILSGCKAGRLVAYKDIEGAAVLVNVFLDSFEMQFATGQIARQIAVNHYSKEMWARRIERFYSEVSNLR